MLLIKCNEKGALANFNITKGKMLTCKKDDEENHHLCYGWELTSPSKALLRFAVGIYVVSLSS